jgi:E3 ubiquitin-protein ligase HECTD2
MDEKTLLLGDFAENGTWWAGGRVVPKNPHRSHLHKGTLRHEHYGDHSTRRPSRLDWSEAKKWYHLVTGPGADWEERLYKLSISLGFDEIPLAEQQRRDIGDQILQAQKHTQRVLLKVTESLLKRPGGPLQHPDHIRFILIILANPLLYPSQSSPIDTLTAPSSSSPPEMSGYAVSKSVEVGLHARLTECAHGPGKHSGIVKRILGLLSNLPNDTHHYLVSWFSKFSVQHFKQMIELVGTFVTYRLSRQNGRQHEADIDLTGDLVPDMPTTGNGGSAALHAALGAAGRRKTSTRSRKLAVYNDDWQIKAAARVMALLFAANSINMQRKEELPQSHSPLSSSSHRQSCPRSQIVPISDFYNTLLDYSDLISDFEAWESKKAKFTFCQYPFFLSIWAKIKIMEHDARRQMEVKAREAFFNSIITRKQVNQYLILKIRRDCLVEDSLKGVSEVVGSGTEEIKKGLRIEFKNEEGIDAGGLRKEWFLLLVRDVFNPNHGE